MYFFEYWEFDVVGECVEILDLFFVIGFLVFEIVGWEIEYGKVVVGIMFL